MTFLLAFLITIAYFILVLFVLSVLLKAFLPVADEVVRKFQHIGYAFSIFLYLELYDPWYQAFYTIAIFMVGVFLFLFLLEKTSFYKQYLIDRKKQGGELKYSLLQGQAMFAILLALFIGILPYGQETFIITAVMSWGFGDALAALIGKYYGKKKLLLNGADPHKTQLGSTAMFFSVFIVVIACLIWQADILWWVALIVALLTAPLATLIEAYTKKGLDTIFLPTSIGLIVYGITVLFIVSGVL